MGENSTCQKAKGGIPGDLLKQIVNEFAPELSAPVTKIFQKIIGSQEWPDM